MANNNNNKFLLAVYNGMSTSLEKQKAALPEKLNDKRYVQNCISYIKESKNDFTTCEPQTVVNTFMKGAYLGLEFGSECYAIPYKEKCEFQTDYKGEKKLAKLYSVRPIQDLYAKVVRKGDVFVEKVVDGRQSIDFSPIPMNNGEIIGAFAVALYKDGGMEYEVMTKEEIEETRKNFSKAPNSKAWANSYGEMCKKTVLRRLTKHIEIDFQTEERAKLWESESDFDVKMPDKREKEDLKNATDEMLNFADDNVIESEATIIEELPEELVEETPFA